MELIQKWPSLFWLNLLHVWQLWCPSDRIQTCLSAKRIDSHQCWTWSNATSSRQRPSVVKASSSAASISSIYTVHPPLNCAIDLGLGHGGLASRWVGGGWESADEEEDEEEGENKDTEEEVSPGCLLCQFPLILHLTLVLALLFNAAAFVSAHSQWLPILSVKTCHCFSVKALRHSVQTDLIYGRSKVYHFWAILFFSLSDVSWLF